MYHFENGLQLMLPIQLEVVMIDKVELTDLILQRFDILCMLQYIVDLGGRRASCKVCYQQSYA